MEIYRLTRLGYALSNNIRPPKDNSKWSVIYYLRKNGAKDKQDICDATGATTYDLMSLRNKKIIVGDEGVTV